MKWVGVGVGVGVGANKSEIYGARLADRKSVV